MDDAAVERTDASTPSAQEGENGLFVLSDAEIEQIAGLVYQLVCRDLHLERERNGW